MTVTPVELKQRTIPRAFFGYSRTAVDKLLDEVATSLELVWRERADMTESVERLEADLASHVDLEGMLRSTLMSAERAAQTHRERALQEADVIIDEARAKARGLTRDAQDAKERLGGTARELSVFLRAALSNLEIAAELASPGHPAVDEKPEPAATGLGLRDPNELGVVKKLAG